MIPKLLKCFKSELCFKIVKKFHEFGINEKLKNDADLIPPWSNLTIRCKWYWLDPFCTRALYCASMSKKFLSPILMKFQIWNPYGLTILHIKFEWNRRRNFFWHRRVPPLDFSRNFSPIHKLIWKASGRLGPILGTKILSS